MLLYYHTAHPFKLSAKQFGTNETLRQRQATPPSATIISRTPRYQTKLTSLIADKNNSWLRIRYGRLSVDSDDQNCNKKCDIDDDDDDALVEYKVDTKCCDKINDNAGSQLYDANGNKVNREIPNVDDVECDCLSVEVDSQIKNTISQQHDALQKDEGTMNKLMSFSLSDYGMFDDLSFLSYLTPSSGFK